ncbi:hypothetical protein ACFWDK_28550 [Micromonospora chalcea]
MGRVAVDPGRRGGSLRPCDAWVSAALDDCRRRIGDETDVDTLHPALARRPHHYWHTFPAFVAECRNRLREILADAG